jgi:hypothetical protein
MPAREVIADETAGLGCADRVRGKFGAGVTTAGRERSGAEGASGQWAGARTARSLADAGGHGVVSGSACFP